MHDEDGMVGHLPAAASAPKYVTGPYGELLLVREGGRDGAAL